MADKDIGRTIRFPQRLWDALDRDAVRCKRSSQKQLEALLTIFYGFGDAEIDTERIVEAQSSDYLAPVVARIDGGQSKAEVRRTFAQGIPVAPTGSKIPLRKTTTQAKRKAR